MDEIEEKPTEQAYIERAKRHQQRHWKSTITMLLGINICVLPLMVATYLYRVYSFSPLWLLVTALLSLGFSLPLITLPRCTLYKERRDFEILLEKGSEESVGALLDGALLSQDLSIENSRFQEKLCLLLPRLTPEQATTSLTPRHRETVRRSLAMTGSSFSASSFLFQSVFSPHKTSVRMEQGVQYTIALLQALSRIGLPEDLPAVEAVLKVTPKNRYITEIQAAARECLPLLQERVAILQDKKTLLRASSPTMDETTLLRPSQSTFEPQEELLRVSSSEAVAPISAEVQKTEVDGIILTVSEKFTLCIHPFPTLPLRKGQGECTALKGYHAPQSNGRAELVSSGVESLPLAKGEI